MTIEAKAQVLLSNIENIAAYLEEMEADAKNIIEEARTQRTAEKTEDSPKITSHCSYCAVRTKGTFLPGSNGPANHRFQCKSCEAVWFLPAGHEALHKNIPEESTKHHTYGPRPDGM